MKFFVDTAEIDAIAELNDLGMGRSQIRGIALETARNAA